MKKLIALIFISSLFSIPTLAITRGTYAVKAMVINLSTQMYDGTSDASPFNLYNLLNLPETTDGKQAKVLRYDKKIMSLMCSKRAENVYECAIVIKEGPQGQIAFNEASFKAEGVDAKAIYDQFFPSQTGKIFFRDQAGVFGLEASEDLFEIHYKSDGL